MLILFIVTISYYLYNYTNLMFYTKRNISLRNLILLIAVSLSLFSCKKKASYDDDLDIKLPSTSEVSSEILWGLTKTPYAKILEDINEESKIVTIVNHGTLLQIVKIKIEHERIWCRVKYDKNIGWIPYNLLNIYKNRTVGEITSKKIEEELKLSPKTGEK